MGQTFLEEVALGLVIRSGVSAEIYPTLVRIKKYHMVSCQGRFIKSEAFSGTSNGELRRSLLGGNSGKIASRYTQYCPDSPSAVVYKPRGAYVMSHKQRQSESSNSLDRTALPQLPVATVVARDSQLAILRLR